MLLHNCHLVLSWMPRLDEIAAALHSQKTHPRFKLCLVTISIAIMYQGQIIIHEIPMGMLDNVMRVHNGFDREDCRQIDQLSQERSQLFRLALLHAVILERP
jgi:dynein heavy chain